MKNIVIYGDRKLSGRILTKHLTDYFSTCCLLITLPDDCKAQNNVSLKRIKQDKRLRTEPDFECISAHLK